MTRPSQNTDLKLIETAKKLIPKVGFSGLKIREICKKAGVNLGMFNYHFKTKEKFVEILLTDVYSQFFKHFQIESEHGKNSYERLKNSLMNIGFFIRDNRFIIMAILEEVIAGNKRIMDFVKSNMMKHLSIMLNLVKECQKDGYIIEINPIMVALSLFPTIAAPNILSRIVEKYTDKTFLGNFTSLLNSMIISDIALKKRVEIALRGVTVRGTNK
ncbi:TetR/AcrR family transcriptional regulator [Elusimicrobiota bacterium]